MSELTVTLLRFGFLALLWIFIFSIVASQGRDLAVGGKLRPKSFLDLRGRVVFGREQGMLSLAFHPAYARILDDIRGEGLAARRAEWREAAGGDGGAGPGTGGAGGSGRADVHRQSDAAVQSPV